mmetsp:Transcript_25365/g.31197  ORF Transcript_25365/g.31197 Transcript_25365/m.31197 type:complete len:228 (-) Transcript_25365:467-1150(-)
MVSTDTDTSEASQPINTDDTELNKKKVIQSKGNEFPSNIQIIPLCVPIPSISSNDFELNTMMSASSISPVSSLPTPVSTELSETSTFLPIECVHVVGTITVMKMSCAMIWIGWGDRKDDSPSSPSINTRDGTLLPPMGPMCLAMPKVYKGSSPCTQITNSENDDDQMIGWQMASRLSKKTGWPVSVSCSLGGGGGQRDVSCHRSAALAEKKIGKILLNLISESSSTV